MNAAYSGMPECNGAQIPRCAPWFELRGFLCVVLLVRLIHLSLLGSWLTGMNPKMAVLAKCWIQHGFGATFIDVAPGPILLLASMASLFGLPPTDLIPCLLLIAHLCLAIAFWYWLRSLQLCSDVEVTSLVLFVFAPCFNSYVGFENYPVLFAAAGFFGAVSIWHGALVRPCTTRSVIRMSVLAASIAFFRSEYLVFMPLYLAIILVWYRLSHGALPPMRAMAIALIMVVALGGGLLAVMSFRHFESGQFALASKDYTCWAFLDGIPHAWQKPDTKADIDRVRAGIAKFGHPAEYDYVASKMIRNNLGKTIRKIILSFPEWLFELGRRHVVFPVPLAAFAILGALSVRRRRTLAAPMALWSALFAAILMTLPLTGLIVSARYLVPAFGAMCVLSATGLLIFLTWIGRMLPRGTDYRTVWWTGIALVCVGLELLLLRGGGLLGNAPNLQPVARYVNEHFGGTQRVPLVLDPYTKNIDAACRANICNRQIYRALGLSMYGFDECDPLTAATSPVANALDLKTAVVWTHGGGDTIADKQRLTQWQQAGFRLVRSYTSPVDDLHRFTIFVLHAPTMPDEMSVAQQAK